MHWVLRKKKKRSPEYQEYFLSLLCPGAKLLACSTGKPLLSDQTMTSINHMKSRTKKIKNSFSCELSLRASWFVSQGCTVLFLSLTGLNLSSGAFTVYGSAEKWLGSCIFNHWNQSREGGAKGRKKQWTKEWNWLRWMESWEAELQTLSPDCLCGHAGLGFINWLSCGAGSGLVSIRRSPAH